MVPWGWLLLGMWLVLLGGAGLLLTWRRLVVRWQGWTLRRMPMSDVLFVVVGTGLLALVGGLALLIVVAERQADEAAWRHRPPAPEERHRAQTPR